MGNIGTSELILILLVLFLFFGSKKIPEIAQGFGKGIREFRKASREFQEDDDVRGKNIENKTPEQKG
jgi:TatA/E family protein of Tat protein translocase